MRAMIIIIVVVNMLLGTNVKLQQTFHQQQSSAERHKFFRNVSVPPHPDALFFYASSLWGALPLSSI